MSGDHSSDDPEIESYLENLERRLYELKETVSHESYQQLLDALVAYTSSLLSAN